MKEIKLIVNENILSVNSLKIAVYENNLFEGYIWAFRNKNNQDLVCGQDFIPSKHL